jgi:hypothetical protein
MAKSSRSGENNGLELENAAGEGAAPELNSAAQGGAEPEPGNENTDNSAGNSKENDGKDKDGGKDQNDKKISLFRFLQLSPKKKGIEVLLFSKHGSDVKTPEQWEITIKDLLCKKVN